MIAALLLVAMSGQGAVRTVELSRGATIQPSEPSLKPFQYWDTSDTFIDGSAPDDSFGGEPVLAAGQTKTVLIRFGDLNRVLGSTRKVKKARLFLTIAGGDKPSLRSIEALKQRWTSGPYFTINALISRNMKPKSEGVKGIQEKPEPPRWSATWRHPLAGEGGTTWQSPGANGSSDGEPIPHPLVTATERTCVIEGLESAVQKMVDHPYANFGFALHFQSECEFFASRAATGQPKLELELEPSAASSGPDLSVVSIQRVTASGVAPNDGGEVNYRVHVKNVGNERSTGFSALWVINGRQGATFEVNDPIEPGAEVTFSTKTTYRLDKSDHRTQTVSFQVTPKTAEISTANNTLTVYANARQIDVSIPSAIAKLDGPNLVGSHGIEDWIQEQVRIFNDTYCAESRYSFAPEGSKERISIQHILVDDAKPTDGALADGNAKLADVSLNLLSSDPAFFRSLGIAAGLPDFSATQFPPGQRVQMKGFQGGSEDLYPGVIGYGDTRYEGSMAGAMSLLYEPFVSASAGLLPLVPSGLLSETDVQAFNSRLDRQETSLAMPKTTLIKATDLSGRPLGSLQLDLFQSNSGEIKDGAPTLTVITSPVEGTAILPNKDGQGPFGRLDPSGSNGAFLVRATANGATAWGWLKAWQVIDTASRGNSAAGVMEVRFNLPSGPLEPETNLARDRIVTDSNNLLPAKLAPLVSGDVAHEVELGGKLGDWVEIDLGRDRTIGEIDLIGTERSFWRQFDVMVYTTGQRPDEATIWTKEQDWNWTSRNRSEAIDVATSTVLTSYRAPSTRIRFIRIVNRTNSTGKLKSIRVVPIKVQQ